jgi:N utilization substance protein B
MATDARSPAGRRQQRSAARLAAVQALYQQAMGGVPVAKLLTEFHDHRLGDDLDGERLAPADRDFFDDLVSGALARAGELDMLIAARLAGGWTLERLDRPMHALLRAGAYELVARADVPAAAVISEYVDVARAFHGEREVGFVNALLDRLAKDVRAVA